MAERAGSRSRTYALGGLALGSIAGLILASVSGAGGPAGVVLAAAALAGLALALILRHIGRRVLGVLLALLGVGMVAGVISGGPAGIAHWAYALCGLLVVAGSVLMVARAQRWPRRPDRFDRTRARAQTSPDDDPNEVWKALDAGHDPTTAARPDDSTPGNARE
ncbi:Trp biosynthesis-associated membrane protein [Enemella evansiae]|uniref:Trp biosynthesis-associated membrane protein n=1 Tax=Enemella evansiae TaxID=2016499 RepID=UPI000B96F6D6|nr:Trp biosynthesis-associated membrane protein [Enemella evansiae]OYO01370.1 hypothetical protein CGZ97_18350 [Enemella evansiae]